MRSMPAIGLPGIVGAGFLRVCSAPEPTEPPTLPGNAPPSGAEPDGPTQANLLGVDEKLPDLYGRAFRTGSRVHLPQGDQYIVVQIARSAELGQSVASANDDLIAVAQRVADNAGWEG